MLAIIPIIPTSIAEQVCILNAKDGLTNTKKIAAKHIDATVEKKNKDFQFMLFRTILAKKPQSPHRMSVAKDN